MPLFLDLLPLGLTAARGVRGRACAYVEMIDQAAIGIAAVTVADADVTQPAKATVGVTVVRCPLEDLECDS